MKHIQALISCFYLLLLGEFSGSWIRAGDIRTETVVLRSHVEEDDVVVVDILVIGSSGMTVMEGGRIVSRSANTSVADLATASVQVGVVQKHGLRLILPHSGLKDNQDQLCIDNLLGSVNGTLLSQILVLLVLEALLDSLFIAGLP